LADSVEMRHALGDFSYSRPIRCGDSGERNVGNAKALRGAFLEQR
jgi:hypothetical protein